MLATRACSAPPQGKEYRMGGHGCVAYERRLFAGIEETHSNIVIRVVRREHKRDLRMSELLRHGEKRGVALAVRVEHDGRRIAGEAYVGKCIYLENSQSCLRTQREF